MTECDHRWGDADPDDHDGDEHECIVNSGHHSSHVCYCGEVDDL